MLNKLIEEIQEKVLNLLLFDEIIHKSEKEKLMNSLHFLYFTEIKAEIFKIIEKVYKKEGEIDTVKVFNEIDKHKEKNLITQRLLDVHSSSPFIYQIENYLKTLHNHSIDNLIIQAKNKEDIKVIKEIQEKFNPNSEKIEHISYKAEEWKEILKNKEKTSVFSLFDKLDEYIGSFQGGDYITLGGATGQGKTMFALNLTKNVLLQGKKVLYCSLEMPIEQLQNRFNCLITGVNANKIRQYNFDLQEIKKYDEGMKQLKEWPLFVSTDYKLTVEKLETYLQKLKPEFLVIDYLGLMHTSQRSSLYEKITQLSRQIKVMATEFNIPVLVLVQLNREVKNRENKMPLLSDIRESGAIEQDSDYVLFVHRESVYDTFADKNNIKIIIAKNRHGEANKIVDLKLNIETQSIENS